MKKYDKPLYEDEEWTPELLAKMIKAVEDVGVNELGLDIFPNELKIITPRQMEDAMVTGALPLSLYHWSYGLQSYTIEEQSRGASYLEVVQNTNPCQLYCIETNSATDMLLVLAHAGIGHNAVYKTNRLFKERTNPRAIVDYLLFARSYLETCEQKFGERRVADVMTACMALESYGIDYSEKKKAPSYDEELKQVHERMQRFEERFNPLFQDRSEMPDLRLSLSGKLPAVPDENILKFIEKNGPALRIISDWQAEIIRIFRHISEYFYPHHRTKVIHEGAACMVHWEIMNRLHDRGAITRGAMHNFIARHGAVIAQPGYRWGDLKALHGINHYSLGFQLFRDIERMCKEQTEEDLEYCPPLAGKDFWSVFRHIIENYDDEIFIQTYASPKLIRDYRFFSVKDDPKVDYYEVTDIHNPEGYSGIRDKLARAYAYHVNHPHIEVVDVDVEHGCQMLLRHTVTNGMCLTTESVEGVLLAMHENIWPRVIRLESVDENGERVEAWQCEDGRVKHYSS